MTAKPISTFLFFLVLAISILGCENDSDSGIYNPGDQNQPDGDMDGSDDDLDLEETDPASDIDSQDYDFDGDAEPISEIEAEPDLDFHHDGDLDSDPEIDTDGAGDYEPEVETDADGDLDPDFDSEPELESDPDIDPELENELELDPDPESEPEDEEVTCPTSCEPGRCGAFTDECGVERYCGECDFNAGYFCGEDHYCRGCPEGSELVDWDEGVTTMLSRASCMYKTCRDTSDWQQETTCENGWYNTDEEVRRLGYLGCEICYSSVMRRACERGLLDWPPGYNPQVDGYFVGFVGDQTPDGTGRPSCFNIETVDSENTEECNTERWPGQGLCCDGRLCQYRCCDYFWNHP